MNSVDKMNDFAKSALHVDTMVVQVVHSHLLPYLDLDGTTIEFDAKLFSFEMEVTINKRFINKTGLNCDIELNGFASNKILMKDIYVNLASNFLTDKGFIVSLKPNHPGQIYIELMIESNMNLLKEYIGVKAASPMATAEI